MNKTVLIFGVVVLAIAGGLVATILLLRESNTTGGQGTDVKEAPLVGHIAPALTLPDMKGVPVTFTAKNQKGPTILHFWRRGCSALCTETIRQLDIFYREQKKKGKFVQVILIDLRDTNQEVLDYYTAEKLAPECPSTTDPGANAEKIYNVSRAPVTFVVDRYGVIREKVIPGDFSSQRDLERLLAPHM